MSHLPNRIRTSPIVAVLAAVLLLIGPAAALAQPGGSSLYSPAFNLEGPGTLTAEVEVDPDELDFTVHVGGTQSGIITLSNVGDDDITWSLSVSGIGVQSSSAVGAQVAGERLSEYDPNGMTAEGVYANTLAYAPAAAGNVLLSWDTGLALPWGVGFDGDVILSNPFEGGGDDHNHRFSFGGEFISKFSTEDWVGSWPADMTYDDSNDLLWQVNVGGDNCLYGLDPDTGAVEETLCGSPWADTSQRGVAYRADDDTFFTGGWNDNIIYHIRGLSHAEPGEVIKTGNFPGVSGLAWDPAAELLWVATNTADDNIYAVDPADGWAVKAEIGHPDQVNEYTGGGLAITEEGWLWMVSQNAGMAYLVDTALAPEWLYAGPEQGTVAAGESAAIVVDVDSEGLNVGTYEATVWITADSGDDSKALTVPVTLTVTDGSGGPGLEVVKPEPGTHTNDDTVEVTGTVSDIGSGGVEINGEDVNVENDGSFAHRLLLPEDDGPFAITVIATDGDDRTTTVTRVITVDRVAPALTDLQPENDETLEWGDSVTIRFTSEPGLEASYQMLMASTGDDGLPGVPMGEVEAGVYEAVYTAPDGVAFEDAEIELYARDLAGNLTRVTAPGKVTVVAGEEPPVDGPTVTITEPADGFLTNRDAVRVSGTAADDQEGQDIEQVTINGREVDVAADGSFSARIILWEGSNTITVTATNTAGESVTEMVNVEADWTAPVLTGLQPDSDITLEQGETYTFRFESESGLDAAYRVVVGGNHGTWTTRDIPVVGTAMTEVDDGVYEATYTAPAGALLDGAIVMFIAADPAGNVTMTTASGEVTIIEEQ